MTVAANLAGVLLALVLLGVEVWVVAIAALAGVVSRPAVTVPVLLRAGAAFGASVLGYVVAVVLIRLALAP